MTSASGLLFASVMAFKKAAVSPLEMTNSFALHGSAMSSSDENIKRCARFIGVLRAVCARTPSVFFVERVLQDFSQCLLARNFFQS
jgi:hypothetical protein